jgi:hypothetical protein
VCLFNDYVVSFQYEIKIFGGAFVIIIIMIIMIIINLSFIELNNCASSLPDTHN